MKRWISHAHFHLHLPIGNCKHDGGAQGQNPEDAGKEGFLTEDKLLGGRQHVQRESDLRSLDTAITSGEWDKPHIGISCAAASEKSRQTWSLHAERLLKMQDASAQDDVAPVR